MNLQKYMFDTGGPDSPHRGFLFWNRPDQYPIRYQAHEVNSLHNLGKTDDVFEYYCMPFDIMNPVDRQNFQVVVDRILAGWYKCKARVQLSGEHSSKIWLEWTQHYRVPAGGRNG